MPRAVVCLTFDLDALSLWLARGITSPTPMSRGEFAVVGARRILALLRRFEVRSTWFIPGHTIQTYPELCREVFDAGHEIGHHGWSHVAPGNLTREQEESGLVRGNEAIRSITGANAVGYRSPAWDLSPHSIELLLAHGFTYDSSMMADDYTPYCVRQGDVFAQDTPVVFGERSPLLEMPVSWTLDDFPHFEYTRIGTSTAIPGLMNANAVLDNWIEDFLYMKDNLDWGAITYTFHPEVIGRGHRMRMLERLIARLRDEGASFERLGDAAHEHIARRVP
jgi:peptidoglycan/xylan/chitin deacetylase (PgdA/CDA1 family)